jgi:hypothetical protein
MLCAVHMQALLSPETKIMEEDFLHFKTLDLISHIIITPTTTKDPKVKEM